MSRIIKYVILIIPLYQTKIMNFFNKHKLTVLVLVVFLFPYFAQAGTCLPVGYSVFTINGINTNIDGATENRDELKDHLPPTYNDQKITVDFLHNKSHGKVIDSLDATNQIYFDQNSLNIQDSDFAQMLTDASAKVTTQKLFLVGHSQGNFYTNTFYDAVADEPGGVPSESVGVYSVGTPATRVAGNGLYLTSDTDKMITGTVAKFPFTNILKSNTHINFNANDGDLLGHSFSKIYLPYEGYRIVSDIKTSLDKLKNNDVQKEDSSCISPPKLTLTQKVQGVTLIILDHSLSPVLDSGLYIATGIYNAGIAIGNKTIQVAQATISSISSLAQSLFSSNSEGLAINNSAVAIAADNQLSDSSQNSTPEPAKENSKPTVKATPPYEITAVQSKPETTETIQAILTIAPVIENKNTTTEEKIITSDTSQNLYPNLLPGGGGVAASNVSITNPVLSPAVSDPALSPTIPDTTPPFNTVSSPVDTVVLPPADTTPPPLDTTPPNTPIITTSNQLVNTNIIVITGTAEDNSIITINGGASIATGVATGGNYSIETILNQNTLNTLNVTATDAANNTSNSATILITHDNIPPMINYLNPYTSPAYTLVVGGTFYLTIIADVAGYTAGPITINDIPVDTFIDNASGFYTATHKVTLGEADKSAGAVPISVVLTDAAGNSNVAYTTVTGNSIAINGHFPASVVQTFPFFNSNGKFTQNVILDCVSNSGYFEMYYVRDSDSTFRMMNLYGDTVLCPGDHQTFVSKDFGFDDFGGYQAEAGWYYGIVSIGNPNCDIYKNNTVCIDNNIQSFFRLHRNAAGIWSDTDI